MPTEAPAPPPPVLAPYLGLVTSVLCAFAGGWLMLAPYALDFRHGAARLPRPAAVDLATGAAITAVALMSALLFAIALFARLRAARPSAPAPATLPESTLEPALESEHGDELEHGDESEHGPESEPTVDLTTTPDPTPEPDPEPDPSLALREMLTPLIAALASDLRRQDP